MPVAGMFLILNGNLCDILLGFSVVPSPSNTSHLHLCSPDSLKVQDRFWNCVI